MSFAAALDFSGKHVLVIGASRGGIGAAIAHAFADCRAAVTITGVEAEPAEADRDRFAYHRLDVCDEAAVGALAGEVDTLDVLVNCAGIARRDQEYDLAVFQQVLDVNLTGTFRTCLAFRPHLKARGGAVVNIASMYSAFASPRVPGYGASKGGVAQLTKSLAVEWAPDGVRVNAIAPGFIVTEQSRRGYDDAEHHAAVVKRTPMARWGEPADIAGTSLYLASPLAAFVTGAVVAVDGGYSAM